MKIGAGKIIDAAMAVTIMCGLDFAAQLAMIVVPVNYALLHGVSRQGGSEQDHA